MSAEICTDQWSHKLISIDDRDICLDPIHVSIDTLREDRE
jgi:hypothetical protein